MTELSDGRLAWQPDIYQRYSLLARLTDILGGEGSGALTLLDVGCGPIALTEAFVAPRFDIVRADVSQFDDPSIVLLQPGEPLPFEDGAFDVAVALDVLEHVPPAQRPSLIRELQRVSRQATIVCCPVDTPEVAEAERQFSAWAQAVSGRDVDFLVEHRENGLPQAAQVVSWFSDPGSALVAENSPLDEWIAFNTLDFIYAYDLGDHEAKGRFAAAVNAQVPLARLDAAQYRRFFCAFTSPAHTASATRVIDEVTARDPTEAHLLVREMVTGILGWRKELRERSMREIDATQRHIGGLDAAVERFKEAVAEKDAHIGKIDQHLAETSQSLKEAQGALAQNDVRLLELESNANVAAEGLASARAELEEAQRQADGLRDEVAATRDMLRQQASTLSAAQARLEETSQRATAVEGELQGILKSRSWRLTAPLRRSTEALRHRTFTIAPVGDLARMRRWVRERFTRRRNYALAAESGLFDANWYREHYPDVGRSNVDPLVHYLKRGGIEMRDPLGLFDARYYLAQTGPLPSDTSPLLHYITIGAPEGRDPHPLFSSSFYLERNPDVAAAGVNPLAHYLATGGFEGRDPHPYFDSSFYLEGNPDVAAAGMNPLLHYVSSGASEGRAPHPAFDGAFYLASNPDVAAAGVNPLVHYVTAGKAEGREAFASRTLASGRLTGYVPPQGRLPWFNPLNVVVVPQLGNEPRLNVLVPGLAMRHLSGGPNTALEIAGRLALSGVRVRLISSDAAFDQDPAPFRAHMRGLLGTDLPADVQLVSANDRAVPLAIGARDLFMATAWWTAQQAKYAVRQTQHSRFVYLIQDYEPLLHPASTQQALATETYSLDHLPVVNSRWLHEFLVRERIGRFGDPAFVERSLVFQPAVDRTLFFPESDRPIRARRRLLFYARPTNAVRNLFELGVAALEKAVADGTLDPERWEFVGMGESFPAVSLGRGASLLPAPWLPLAGYAQQMRDSDILLSLMLSPHPSYPPLEMAACGGLVVTTTFANKTSEALAQISANIIGVPPTLEGISEGLEAAVARLDDVEGRRAAAAIDLPASWRSSMAEVVPRLFDELAVLQGSPVSEGERSRDDERTSIIAPGFRNWPRDEYEVHRVQAFERRRTQYPSRPQHGLISLLTPVWNTPRDYLEALADSILSQDADAASFEWVVLDNGSDDPATTASIERLRRERGVRVLRSERNLGIVEGTRLCLEHAVNRYTATVDHDDLLTPDCIRVVSHALDVAGYPALAYTDEDRLEGDRFSLPYMKPSFDPVLFANSCYIAHLSIVDRQLALQLGAYTDKQAEGSHDWDTFTRFVAAGHAPMHIPEVLYSWRAHETSTSGGNVHSKPFVYESQRFVLTKLLETLAPTGGFRLEPSPLFGGTPDWWMRRDATNPRPVTTVVLASSRDRPPRLQAPNEVPHEVVHLDPADGVVGLVRLAAQAAESGRLLHVVWHDTRIVDDVWALEAMGLFELFPDTAMVGGRLHHNGRIVDAGAYFGFGRGCDAPDRGRPLQDPGYNVQAWKQHSVSAVSIDHAVLDPKLALDALASLARADISLASLGAWLGAAFRRQGRRVIYSPYLTAETNIDRATQVRDVEHEAFKRANVDLMPDLRYLSPHIALRAPAYQPASIDERRRPFGDPGPVLTEVQMLEADRMARAVLPRASSDVSFSILTSVYSRTPAQYFELTARSLLEQRHVDFEWIVLENGPVSDEVARVLDRIAADPRVHRFACAENVGILGAMRQCLARAAPGFVVPLDADDVLEPDALEVLAAAIDREQADFVFSDEDHLTGDRAHAPFLRPGFDPVLNIEGSYIWHLCAFSGERALELGVYSDDRAEYCHDWDTIVRFSEAGLRIAHVPHVLYHWRSHDASSSNVPMQNPGTIASTRAVLERIVAGRSSPSRYEIDEYPIDRGAVEWWIRRRPIDDPSFGVVLLGADERSSAGAAASDSFAGARSVVAMPGRMETLDDWRRLGEALPGDVEYVVVLGERWRPEGEAWLWEAIKWFELQPDTAIVGGRLVGDDGVVVDAGLGSRGHEVLPVYRGLRRSDPGAFSLALKAQTIHSPSEGFFVGHRAFLQSAVESVLRDGFSEPFAATIGALASTAGRRVVYSPLLEARQLGIVRPAWSGPAADRPASAPGETMAVGSA